MTESRTRRWPKVLGAVAVVLVIAVVVGVLALDRILLSQVRKQTDQLSRDLGRPVTVEGVKTKLLGGLGLRLTGVGIGPADGEGLPLLELPRAEVEADLVRALRSRGQDLVVREAVVEGLRVNVIRFPDGTTNVERLSNKLAERAAREQPAGKQPGGEAKPSDLSAVRIDRAAVENARIAFVDRGTPGAKELFVEDLDVEVRDLRAGQPLEVVVKAAVLASKQNLELHLKAAPLPPTLVPTPELLTLKVEPIDLDPLAPFIPASIGLRGGRFQADLSMALGAAVPGGKGKTTLKGGFQARQLAFTGQAGGKRLDASLAADLEADAEAGDLRIGKLDLEVGPAGLTGKGRATGLTGESPKVEGLEIVSHGLDPAVLAEYYPPLRKQMGGVVMAGPVGLSLRGSGTEAAQAVELNVDLRPVRLVVPEQLSKAAGAPMSLSARADASQGGGRVRFDAALDLAGADLRPGGTLAKKPGDPMSMKVAGAYRKAGDKVDVELSRVDLDLLGDRLTGKGQVAMAGKAPRSTTRFDLALSGDRLDLDRLLIPAPKEEKGKAAPEPASKPLDPATFAGLSGVAAARLGQLRMERMDARNVVLRVKVVEDAVTLEEARLEAFGGSVSAAGTAMKLAHPDEPFTVKADLKGVEGAQVLGLFSTRKVLGGKLDAGLELGGRGRKLDPLLKTLTGSLRGTLGEGTFYGKDLLASVAAPIAGRLPFAAGKITEGGSTSLGKQLPFSFRFSDGVAHLEKPLEVKTGDNALSFTGGVGLDGALEMPATVALGPELIAKITGGRARPTAPIPVTFRLTGPAWSPRLDGLVLDAAVKAIASQAAQGAAAKLLGQKGGAAAGAVADPAKAKAEAEARAREEADRQRNRLEEQAKKKLKGLFGR
jgi:AsmA protein